MSKRTSLATIAASAICLIPIHSPPISTLPIEKVRTLSLMRNVTIPTSVYAIPPSIMLDVRPETSRKVRCPRQRLLPTSLYARDEVENCPCAAPKNTRGNAFFSAEMGMSATFPALSGLRCLKPLDG
jgi:hypothetical protein